MKSTDLAARVVEEGDRLFAILDQHGLPGVAGYLHSSKDQAREVLLAVRGLQRLIGSLARDLPIGSEAP